MTDEQPDRADSSTRLPALAGPGPKSETERVQQIGLFGLDGLPEGFAYQSAVLSEAEEGALRNQLAALELQPFEFFHGYLGRRRVHSYGWRYDYGQRALQSAEPLPGFLRPLRAQVAALAGIGEEDLQQALVTEYAPGAGIGWHKDKAMFDEVFAVSLGAACRLRFRRRETQGWQRAALTIEPRSLYAIRGAARRIWEHSIPPVDGLRYSVTFRSFASGDP